MDGKQFKLKPHQVEALKELRENMGDNVECWAGGGKTEVVRRIAADYADLEAAVYVQEFGRSRRNGKQLTMAMYGCTTVTTAAAMAHRELTRSIAQNRENTVFWDEIQFGTTKCLPLPEQYLADVTKSPIKELYEGVWRDEVYNLDDLPFTSKEHTPFCRNVRVWDAKGFSPAVELCNRHPDLLVADDWLRATTFDLYAMAIKTSQSYYADLNIDHIKSIKWWVKYLKEVQAYEFSDTVAPAKVYHGYRLENDMRGLFKRRSNDDSPKRQYINVVINWRARTGRF